MHVVTYRWRILIFVIWVIRGGGVILRGSSSSSSSCRRFIVWFLVISGFAKYDRKSLCGCWIVHIPLSEFWQWPPLVLLLIFNTINKYCIAGILFFNSKFVINVTQKISTKHWKRNSISPMPLLWPFLWQEVLAEEKLIGERETRNTKKKKKKRPEKTDNKWQPADYQAAPISPNKLAIFFHEPPLCAFPTTTTIFGKTWTPVRKKWTGSNIDRQRIS